MIRMHPSRANRILIAVVAGLIGLATSVALYLGLVHAVPLVSWGTYEEELLRIESAHDVRLASVFAVLAGVLLLTARAWWTGGIAVAAACLLAVLAHENTTTSWALLLVYELILLVGCGTVAVGTRSPRMTGLLSRRFTGRTCSRPDYTLDWDQPLC